MLLVLDEEVTHAVGRLRYERQAPAGRRRQPRPPGVRGGVAIAHGAYWHTVRPNKTARSCLLGMYIRPCFIAQEDMRGQLAEIEDPSEEVKQLWGPISTSLANVLPY